MNFNKKLQKKLAKKKALLAGDTDLQFSDDCELNIAICNAGLANGLSMESLLEAATKFGCIADIIMIPNKSYCFLKFSTLDDSIKVFDGMNSTSTNIGQHNAALILAYTKKVPLVKNPWNQEIPDGLVLLDNFIEDEYETQLINLIKNEYSECQLKNRKVIHYGYEFIYGTNNVDSSNPLTKKIPVECEKLWKLLAIKLPQFAWFKPDQLTVNVYEPGHGIPYHVDTHSPFYDPIISLSLESDVVMEFRQNESQRNVLLRRKSLLIMSGESRYGWQHGITPRTMDIVSTSDGKLTTKKRSIRVSFTFRKIKIPPSCSCNFPQFCDVIPENPESDLNENYERLVDDKLAVKLEIENVHNVYNEIGNHFSDTRHTPWPNVEEFVNSIPKNAILLDVGCGNGKYLSVNNEIMKIGCDRSLTLLEVCQEKRFNVFQCDCLHIPFKDSSVDACISIAVIHHLATRERRIRALREMARVLVKGGKALIYCWAKNQAKDNKKSSYLKQNSKPVKTKPLVEAQEISVNDNLSLPIHTNRTQFAQQNVFVPWKLKDNKESTKSEDKVFMRYYHVFEEHELSNMCKEIEDIELCKSYYDQGNWCVIFEKIL